MSPSSDRTRPLDEPLCTSTPCARPLANGHDAATARADVINGNVTVNIVSESTYSMDVLSGGESDAGDTLSRRNNNNNNSISCSLTSALRDGTVEGPKRRAADVPYFVAKELLMTERTYKRDLELVTVTWSRRVSELASGGGGGAEAAVALARACLALEPLALACGTMLARLERVLASPLKANDAANENEEPEYKKIDEYLHEYLSSTSDAYAHYTEHAGTIVAVVESVRRCNEAARAECLAFEAVSPLPFACLLLRPLHRLLHYEIVADELCAAGGGARASAALALARGGAAAARRQLRHVENHAALCQLQRDVIGYDKLLVPDREFIRLGCVYKHSTRGLQQRMLFLFSDLLLVLSRGGAQFRAHAALPLASITLQHKDLPHTFEIQTEDTHLLISTSNEHEYTGWTRALAAAIAAAPPPPPPPHGGEPPPPLQAASNEHDTESAAAVGGAALGGAGALGGALAHVCWHRAASLPRDLMHRALQTQLSGYLLRKFKKSPGWQKLWVVFAVCTLFFYKTWRDRAPLASLPLLGYGVAAPSEADAIDKEFVFKLQFKNHVYFFRADSQHTYNRWVEVLNTPMVQDDHN